LFLPASFKWLTLLDKYAFHNVLITNKQRKQQHKKKTNKHTQKHKKKQKQNKTKQNKKTNKQIFPVIK
jgi:hypothetical protein